jgi:hypothetical protein
MFGQYRYVKLSTVTTRIRASVLLYPVAEVEVRDPELDFNPKNVLQLLITVMILIIRLEAM